MSTTKIYEYTRPAILKNGVIVQRTTRQTKIVTGVRRGPKEQSLNEDVKANIIALSQNGSNPAEISRLTHVSAYKVKRVLQSATEEL